MRWLVLLAVLCGCDLFPMDPPDTKGNPGKAATCALAEDMMKNPAKYDPEFPSEVVRRGRDLWNGWNCGGDGGVEK